MAQIVDVSLLRADLLSSTFICNRIGLLLRVEMAEVVDGKCDVEHLEINKLSCLSLKFDWTVEYFNSKTLNAKSSEINLPGLVWYFVLKSIYNISTKKYSTEIQIIIDQKRTVDIYGTIKINHEVYQIHKSLSSYQAIITGLTLVDPGPAVCKLLFNLKVYGNAPSIFTQDHRNFKLKEDECLKNLRGNFKSLWKNPKFSDVRFQVGEETIAAHKSVLFARSPVFARMFLSPSVESKQDLVTVEDVSFGIMERFLAFLYGDFPDLEASQDLEELCELYYVSDKYEVVDLRDWCSQVMIERMTTENVFRMMDLFDSHSDAACMKLAEDYCLLHFKEVMETDGWKAINLKKPNFASLMLKRMSNYIQ